MAEELIIRKLQETDIEPLSVIEAASFSMPWSAKDFADLLKHDYCVYFVAEYAGEVAGCCGMTNICREGNIDNVVVAERFRGKGIATALLRRLMEAGDAMGVQAYTLEVRISNQIAIHVYEKLGFVSEGIRPGFYERPVEDACIMWKR